MKIVFKDGRLVSAGEFVPTHPDHPVMPVPTREQVLTMDPDALVDMLVRREELLVLEKTDPYRYGYEPSMWRLTDLMMGWPWMTDADRSLSLRVLRKLGYPASIKVLLMQGGNRAGKTQYCARTVMRLLQSKPGARAWVFHSTRQMSVEYHHALLWLMLPAEQRRTRHGNPEYISYSQQNGFAGDKFTLANGSSCVFRNYEQKDDTIEGGECDIIWCDELLPAPWLKTLEARVATRTGRVLVSFTPVRGYTPLVGQFREGASVAFEETAWLVPRDASGSPDYDRASSVRDMVSDVLEPPAPSPGFKRVPRIERCPDPRRAVVYFHTGDNPYGNPREIFDINVPAGEVAVRERCYGQATKSMRVRFAVDDAVHVVDPADIPSGGTNHMACDPSSARNWFMLWARFHEDEVYIYREWPDMLYPVDGGHGLLGPWAEYDGVKPDGRKGPGQESLGFGLSAYKRLIAKLEGWKDAERAPDGLPSGGEDVAAWRESNGARERIASRIIDSRFASAPKLERDTPKTLISGMDDLGVFFDTASGATVETGCELIVDALNYDRALPLGFMNRPRLRISSECRNLLYALKTWTGKDGNEGATKDPIDVLRYLFTADLADSAAIASRLASEPDGESSNYY